MDHDATMRAAYERINEGDLEGFGALLAENFVEHEDLPGLSPTKEGTLEFFRGLLASFPDTRMDVEDVIISGDKGVARVTFKGTHQGEFMGLPASGTSVEMAIIDIMRFDSAGLACEHWGLADMLSMLQQLGVVPAGPPG
ncbi:MAG TPA: ester cyclase [Acidimicrobiales bacterium]